MCQNTTMRVYGAWIKYIMLYVQKHITPLVMCYNPPLVRDKPLGVPAFVKLIYLVVASDPNIWSILLVRQLYYEK